MEKIIAHIRPIDWTEGDVYGVHLRLAGTKPFATINWGDGKKDTYWGNEIYSHHIYPKDSSLYFIIEVEINADEILYADPCGGDVENILFDFSQAPSTREIGIQNFENVIFDNPNLENLSMTIILGKEYDLSKCPNLRHLIFSPATGMGCRKLDLSKCHKLESFSCWGYLGPDLKNLIIANDAPLKEIDITGHDLHHSCLAAIHRIIERNNGTIAGELEELDDEEQDESIYGF